MNDTIDRLVIHLDDAANVAQTGDPEVAHSGGTGGQNDLLAAPRDDGEGASREGSRHQAAVTEVSQESSSQEEWVRQDGFELRDRKKIKILVSQSVSQSAHSVLPQSATWSQRQRWWERRQ